LLLLFRRTAAGFAAFGLGFGLSALAFLGLLPEPFSLTVDVVVECEVDLV